MKKRRTTKTGIPILAADDKLFETDDRANAPPDRPEDFAALLEESWSGESFTKLLESQKPDDGCARTTARRPQRRYPPPQDDIDLHGLTAAEAGDAAEAFVRESARRKLRTIRIIVGKGLHSQGNAVLPDIVEKRIVLLKKAGQVATFQWERRSKRRSGALIVHLRRR